MKGFYVYGSKTAWLPYGGLFATKEAALQFAAMMFAPNYHGWEVRAA